MTTTTDFQINIAVSSSAAEAFDQVCRVADWWTTDIEGETRGLGSSFTVRFADTSVEFQITEFVPGETVSWAVTNCYLPFLNDQTEWTGTTVRFDVKPTNEGSIVTLTHVGLRPGIECFEMCSVGWTYHFGDSLRALIQDGKGEPKGQQLHATVSVPATAAECFEAICRVSKWWSTEFEGDSRSLGDVFKVHFGEQHMSECKITEISLGQRITWEVTDCNLSWMENKTEWTGTQIIWVIQEREGIANITLTHKGLTPESECFTNCRRGWEYFASQSLARLITEGKGRPGIPETTGGNNE
jgi:hypothetical protein